MKESFIFSHQTLFYAWIIQEPQHWHKIVSHQIHIFRLESKLIEIYLEIFPLMKIDSFITDVNQQLDHWQEDPNVFTTYCTSANNKLTCFPTKAWKVVPCAGNTCYGCYKVKILPTYGKENYIQLNY